jgi:hypothetical protein
VAFQVRDGDDGSGLILLELGAAIEMEVRAVGRSVVEGVCTGIGRFIDNRELATSGNARSNDSVKGLIG